MNNQSNMDILEYLEELKKELENFAEYIKKNQKNFEKTFSKKDIDSLIDELKRSTASITKLKNIK